MWAGNQQRINNNKIKCKYKHTISLSNLIGFPRTARGAIIGMSGEYLDIFAFSSSLSESINLKPKIKIMQIFIFKETLKASCGLKLKEIRIK